MASVRKVATKRGSAWQARWRERGRARAMNFASKRAADDCARRMGELVERRGVGDAERLSTGAYLVRFVAEIEASGEYSPATVTAYRKMAVIVSRVIGRRRAVTTNHRGDRGRLRGAAHAAPETAHARDRALPPPGARPGVEPRSAPGVDRRQSGHQRRSGHKSKIGRAANQGL